MRHLVFAVLLSAAVLVASPGAALPPGGLSSVDFFKGARERAAAAKAEVRNLMPVAQEHWQLYKVANRASLHEPWTAEWTEREKRMTDMVQQSVRLEDGVPVWRFAIPAAINQFRNEKGLPFYYSRVMAKELVAVEPGRMYHLSYRVRGTCQPPISANRVMLTIDYYGKDRKRLRNVSSTYRVCSPTLSWSEQAFDFRMDPRTHFVRIHYCLQNIGEIELQTGTLAPAVQTDGFDASLFPMGVLDNQCHIPQGQLGFVSFFPINQSPRKAVHPRMRVTIPPPFRYVAPAPYLPAKDFSDQPNPDGSHTYTFGFREYRWGDLAAKDYAGSFPLLFALTTDAAPSDRLYPVTYQCFDDGYEGPVHTCHLRVIAPLHGERPRLFQSGIYDSRTMMLPASVFPRFVKEYAGNGFNICFTFHSEQYVADAFHQHGIPLLGSSSFIANGYACPLPPEKRPAYTHFIGVDGKPVTDFHGRLHQLICPMAVINRTPFYQETILGEAKQRLKTSDYLMSNWEPGHAQTSGGCFCANCKQAFIAYSKLSAAEVEAAWPANIVGKYRTEWMNFKSHQHALYLETYERDLDAIARSYGKKGSGFMPMITRDIMLDTAFNLNDVNAFAVRFYADRIKWINPWGPYLAHHWRDLKRDLPGSRIRMLTMARSAARFLKLTVKDPAKRPKLLAFPCGVCVNMLVAPEQLAMDTLSVYVGGWQGSTPYYFPVGYDARYWRALAEANTAIARTERYVMEGTALPAPAVELLTPFPRPLYAELNTPDRPISSLQVAPFARDGGLCLAVGNFWEYGEAFFTAQLPGLQPKQRYLVRDAVSGTAFCDDDGKNFTGAQLAKGGALVLHAGGLRWRFYTVEPAAEAAPQGALRAKEVRALLAARLPGITKAAAEENAFLLSQARPSEAPSDVSPLRDFHAPGVSVTVTRVRGTGQPVARVSAYDTIASNVSGDRTVLTIQCGESTWKVEPDRGAFLASWRFRGHELCSASDTMGLALDGPWTPTVRFTRPFQLTRAEAIPGGVALEFTRTLNANDGRQYENCVLVKRLAFTGNRVVVDSTIRNPFNDTVRFAYRYQNLPGPVQPAGDFGPGAAHFVGPDGPFSVKSPSQHTFYKLQGSPDNPDVLRVLFGRGAPRIVPIARPEAVFRSADGKVALKVTVAPAVDFHGFVSCAESTLLTYEPVFNTCEIPVGRTWHAQMTLEAQ